MQSVIEVKPIQTQEAKEALVVAERMLGEVQSLTITNQPTYDHAADALKHIKTRTKNLEDRRKEITKPLDVAKKSVMELFRKPLIMLVDAERIVKKGMIVYTDEQERIRREKEAKLRRQAEAEERRKKEALEKRAKKAEGEGKLDKAEQLREQKEEVSVEAPVLAQTTETPQGVAYKDRWYAVVIDKAKVPIAYLEPNMSALNKFASATKGKVPLAGVEFKSEKIVASRTM